MAITDADQLLEVEWRLVEDASFTSGLWTIAEIAGYYNQRQNRFNRDAKLLLAYEAVAVGSGATTVALPEDWIATQRATWRSAAGVISPVGLSDRFAAQQGIASATAPTVPLMLDDQSAGPRVGELYPPPITAGTLGLVYASLCEILNFNGTGDIFDLPDEFVPYITYGVMADMLSKDGRGQDLVRAKYCEERFEEGIALAAILLTGFV